MSLPVNPTPTPAPGRGSGGRPPGQHSNIRRMRREAGR